MTSSLRTRRMARNHKRLAQSARLNLVALMDIFTILVLFLMVNNGDVEVLQSERDITLPESVSEQRPEPALTIKVNDTDIVVGGRRIASIDAALAEPGSQLESLGKELRYHSSRAGGLADNEREAGRAVIIMGDQDMPYTLLKRIMTTCAQSDYRDIALAVNSDPAPPDAGLQDGRDLLAAGGG